jgi:hypothetical protein
MRGCFIVASTVWSNWKYDRNTKTYAEQMRAAQRQLDQSAEDQRQSRELMAESAEQQRRAATPLEREEALVTAIEGLVRRLESRP